MAVTAVKSSMLIMHLSAAITGREVTPGGIPKHLQKDVYKYPHPRTLFFHKKRSLPLPLGTPSNQCYLFSNNSGFQMKPQTRACMDALSVCIEHLLIRVSPLLHSLYNISGFFFGGLVLVES